MTGALNPFRSLAALLMVAVAGAILLPWQVELQGLSRQSGFRTTPLDLSLREQIGQSGFLAALSGFRSPLAAFLWIEAHSAWEKTEWGRMNGLFNTVTTLQPHSLLYWDIAAWHMAWNASACRIRSRRARCSASGRAASTLISAATSSSAASATTPAAISSTSVSASC